MDILAGRKLPRDERTLPREDAASFIQRAKDTNFVLDCELLDERMDRSAMHFLTLQLMRIREEETPPPRT